MGFSTMRRTFLFIGDVVMDGWRQGWQKLLQCLPEDSKYRPRILKGYRKMMKSLKKYQMSDGLWNQLIDQPDCWAEFGSAMFTLHYTGVKQGWLKAKEYGPAAAKHGWL